jgi:hypothetical protein
MHYNNNLNGGRQKRFSEAVFQNALDQRS